MDRGLIMGSAISPLAADMFMNFLEEKYILSSRNPYRDQIVFWARYADDVFMVFGGSSGDLSKLHDYLNGCHETIKFTLEIEKNNKLCYLDLEIEKDGGGHKFCIYRKPSSTDLLIPADSFHHYQYKMAGLIHLVDRLLNVPMESGKYDAEVKYIKHMASSNGYEEGVVEKLINRRLKRKISRELQAEDEDSSRKKKEGFPVSIPFLGPLSVKIGENLKKIGIPTAFKSRYSLKSLLPRVKDYVDPLDRSGVYRLSCTTCDASYVGQSGRKVRTRFKEHLTRETEFYTHTQREGHDKSAVKYQLLYEAKKGKMMTIAEGLHIKLDRLRQKDKCINKQGEGSVLRYVTDASLIALQSSQRATLVESCRL